MPIAKIRIQTENSDAFVGDFNQPQSEEEKKRVAFISFAVHQSINIGKKAFQESVSLIGISTGDYAKQEMIEQMMGITSKAISIGGSFAVNPYLGIANVIATTTSDTLSFVKRQKEIERINEREKIMARRSGNALTNGSRTGN